MDKTEDTVYLKCKDHTVSGKSFSLVPDENHKMLRTSPAPGVEELPEYYKSEDYISHTDARRSWFEKIYHLVKNYALKQKLKYINAENPEKGMLLDIGAGTGDFLTVAKNDGWKVSGTEPNASARKRAGEKGVSLIEKTDASFVRKHISSYDVITMWHVLEHVPNLEEQLQELKELLKKSGTLFIAVPNFRAYDAKHYGAYWAAYDVPRHLWHFSADAIRSLFSEKGMKVVRTIPMKFDAFYVSLLSEKYKNGKMNFFRALWTGWLSNRKAARTGEYSSLIYVIKHQNN
ncbi:class I SAM-dependent methyltransferase [Sinomicrobium weinanense]|uniref:Class I SAM-dependent methyltransferase n=1 Tax=Sinomicrobium weinanense TaxID=2842200 RepID=A0A926Q357_9FLAO|nr:class I SAM-dependent methyltransferase [Sinomicrobium weinanense]MBC9797287.1 class I SAM-dependent methyltransferase [Sinomicrobium weinanense]MBU3125420.1 class I SAM-dependent methyltransferase [Sinomicrobium weinanense]